MKIFVILTALLFSATAFTAESGGIDVVVNDIPPGASEVVVVVDTATPPPPSDYQDPAAAPATPPLPKTIEQIRAQAAPADPAVDPAAKAQPAAADAAGAPRRRRGGAGRAGRGGRGGFGAPVAIPPVRQAVETGGASSVTVHVARAAGENYRVRAIAMGDDGRLPAVLAGGHADRVKVAASQMAPVALRLKSPVLKLSPANPSAVAAGERFTLAGTITDAAQCLGTKNRMRVWLSENSPLAANHAGTQTSTVDVTTNGNDIEFTFNLTAPKTPGTLFFQFGEVPPDFAREDGTQAPLLVLPNLATGASALQLPIGPPKSIAKSD